MDTVYLMNGQEAQLKKKIAEGEYLVIPLFTYEDFEGHEYQDYGDPILVPKILSSPPTPVIESSFLEKKKKLDAINDSISKASKQLTTVESQVAQAQKTQTNLNDKIINLSELRSAERISVFNTKSFTPSTLSEKDKKSLKIHFSISVINGDLSGWVYQWYGDTWSSGNNIDADYGFLINKTDEELEAIAVKRSGEMNFENVYESKFLATDDKYLCPELIEKKERIRKRKKSQELEKAERELQKHQEKVNNLKLEQ